MARLMGLQDVDPDMASSISSLLRPCDEAVLLPQSHKSIESGVFKNIVFRLDGNEPAPPVAALSPNMFAGISMIRVSAAIAVGLLANSDSRAEALTALTRAIPSELTTPSVQVGTALDGDNEDRDLAGWVAGFDGPGCCVGLYSAQESQAVSIGPGTRRTHTAYYLIAKAGGGLATQTFYTRLVNSLSKGTSLDNALLLGDSPGPSALRRASVAASRNRNRILVMAARALGIADIDTVSDAASPLEHTPYRAALPIVDVHLSGLRRDESGGRRMWVHASGCVDASSSLGVISASNVADGFLVFSDQTTGSFDVSIRNTCLNCIPFATERLMTNRDAVVAAARAHYDTKDDQPHAHPDTQWIRDHFSWTDADGPEGVNGKIEPPCLWGSFAPESFADPWGRELGLVGLHTLHLRPELVHVAGSERAKLKAARQHSAVKRA